MHIAQPFPNHNGGAVVFGPDGMLYIGMGDGGSGGDPQGNGQRLDTHLAKILRIDVDVPTGQNPSYRVPPDNPFTETAGALPEIWHTGVRNPWRMRFDPANGDLWIGDVGQNAWEEIDVARSGQKGLNFGWNTMEGVRVLQPERWLRSGRPDAPGGGLRARPGMRRRRWCRRPRSRARPPSTVCTCPPTTARATSGRWTRPATSGESRPWPSRAGAASARSGRPRMAPSTWSIWDRRAAAPRRGLTAGSRPPACRRVRRSGT